MKMLFIIYFNKISFLFQVVTMKSSRLNFVAAQVLANFNKIYNWNGLRKLKNYCQTKTKNVGWFV